MTKKKENCKSWVFCNQTNGGGFGRLLFIIGVLYALDYMGMLEGVPSWVLVLIALGFSWMRF